MKQTHLDVESWMEDNLLSKLVPIQCMDLQALKMENFLVLKSHR